MSVHKIVVLLSASFLVIAEGCSSNVKRDTPTASEPSVEDDVPSPQMDGEAGSRPAVPMVEAGATTTVDEAAGFVGDWKTVELATLGAEAGVVGMTGTLEVPQDSEFECWNFEPAGVAKNRRCSIEVGQWVVSLGNPSTVAPQITLSELKEDEEMKPRAILREKVGGKEFLIAYHADMDFDEGGIFRVIGQYNAFLCTAMGEKKDDWETIYKICASYRPAKSK